jgi:hypothetical protein
MKIVYDVSVTLTGIKKRGRKIEKHTLDVLREVETVPSDINLINLSLDVIKKNMRGHLSNGAYISIRRFEVDGDIKRTCLTVDVTRFTIELDEKGV